MTKIMKKLDQIERRLKEKRLDNFLMAVEIGYLLCEKGNNLQSALEKAKKAYDEGDDNGNQR